MQSCFSRQKGTWVKPYLTTSIAYPKQVVEGSGWPALKTQNGENKQGGLLQDPVLTLCRGRGTCSHCRLFPWQTHSHYALVLPAFPSIHEGSSADCVLCTLQIGTLVVNGAGIAPALRELKESKQQGIYNLLVKVVI